MGKAEVNKEGRNFLQLNGNERNIPKPMGHREGSSEKQVHSIKCLHQIIREISISNFLAYPKALEQEETTLKKKSIWQEITNFGSKSMKQKHTHF